MYFETIFFSYIHVIWMSPVACIVRHSGSHLPHHHSWAETAFCLDDMGRPRELDTAEEPAVSASQLQMWRQLLVQQEIQCTDSNGVTLNHLKSVQYEETNSLSRPTVPINEGSTVGVDPPVRQTRAQCLRSGCHSF